MDWLLFIPTILAISILAIPIFLRTNLGWWIFGIILIISSIISSNGTRLGCKDNRISYSIWTQWACSRHGGVVSRLNDLGSTVLIIDLIIIIFALLRLFLYNRYQDKKIKKKK